MNALSLMLTRRYHAGGGTLPYFGSHRIRHATATFLVNNGMPLEEVSKYLGTARPTSPALRAPHSRDARRAAAEALARAGCRRNDDENSGPAVTRSRWLRACVRTPVKAEGKGCPIGSAQML